MAAYVIRTIPSAERQTIMYYNGCGAPEWQSGFPEIFGKERAEKTLIELKKRWKDIEVAPL